MIYTICRAICKIILILFFRIEVQGKDKIPRKGPFILASNHISNLDPVAVGVALPRKVHYLAKQELFQNKIFGALLRKLWCIPLKRDKGDASALRRAVKVLKNQEPLVIFPQGQRSWEIELEKAKGGVGFLFKKTKAPLIAAHVFGTDEALPRGSERLRFRKIRVVFDKVTGIEADFDKELVVKRVLDTIKSLS